MGFFKDLSERIGDYSLTLTIAKDKGQLIVMLVPKLDVDISSKTTKDDVLKEIIPLTVKGTPDQLDAGFILAISQGIQMTTGLQTNIKEFEAGLKKAEKKIKGKDDKDQKSFDKKADKALGNKTDDDKGSDDDDNNSNEDDLPFSDGDNVDTETGEIKEPAEKKEPEPKTKVEPKAKEQKPKEEKKESAAPTALTGEMVITADDEWD